MAYAKKKKSTRNISEFTSHKKVCELNKNHSPITILFCTNDFPDEWHIEVLEYRTKSGVIVEDYMINSKSLDSYVEFMGKSGFDKITKF